jgi:phage tail sheath protein FI
MPEYLSPGVYIEEIDAGPKPIAPVATSTAGAVGVTQRGPTTPTLVTNYGEYVRTFGGPLPIPDEGTREQWSNRGYYWQTAESVKAFFDEGGARMYFQRVMPGGAKPSVASFGGGLVAALAQDVSPVDRTIQLTHVFAISPDTTFALVTPEGTAQVTAASVDYTTRTVTLTAPAGISARRGRDLATILAVAATPAVLTATAATAGAWGDDISVQIQPTIGARRTLGATPASGNRVATHTTAAADAGATDITVTPVPGSLDKTTPKAPFLIQINGGAPVGVTTVAEAASDLKLTLAAPLVASLPIGSDVAVVRQAVADTVVTVVGADRLYPNAVVQLEGAAGAEVFTVTSIAGAQVTLSAVPQKAYVEGDGLTILEADVKVRYRPVGGTEEVEHFGGLRLTKTPSDPTSLIGGVNLNSRLVRLAAGPGYSETNLQAFPAAATGAWVQLGAGNDALLTLTTGDFIGINLGPGQRTGIQALEEIDQVAICIVPGMWDADIRNALIVHCETLGDRFAILDPPPNLSVQEIEAFRSLIDTKYAALYYPWVEIRDPRPGGDGEQAPPSGFMAGIYARTDIARGVHKAPANEVIRSIRGLAQTITKREQDILNPENINVLRAFPGRGNRVWGARVLTSDAAWKYVPVRRLFLMIEESIDEGTQFVVFEPNDEPLWARVRQSVTNFLITQWRLGALQGVTADEAFFVACDRSTMTQDDIDNGRLICKVGIAPVKPAEFVIFRIQQKTLELTTN